jgi:hypothetical protein
MFMMLLLHHCLLTTHAEAEPNFSVAAVAKKLVGANVSKRHFKRFQVKWHLLAGRPKCRTGLHIKKR